MIQDDIEDVINVLFGIKKKQDLKNDSLCAFFALVPKGYLDWIKWEILIGIQKWTIFSMLMLEQ